VEAMEPCQPAGIFTLLSVRNNARPLHLPP